MDPTAPGQPDPNRLGAEALLATVGLHVFLTHDPSQDGRRQPIRLTETVRANATALPFRWRTRIRAILRAATWDDEATLPDWDYEDVARAMTVEQTPEDLAHRLDLGDADLTLALTIAAGNALQVAKQVFPARSTQSLLGAKPCKPSDIELSRLRLVWTTLDNPDLVLRDLGAGVLTHRQMGAFAQAYPTLTGFLAQLITTEAVNLREEQPNKELARAREAQLAILLGMPPLNAGLAKRLQANYADPASAQVPGQQGPPAKPLSETQPMDQTSTTTAAGAGVSRGPT